MEDEITHWLDLPAGTKFLTFKELPSAIASAIWRADQDDFDGGFTEAAAAMNIAEELKRAVDSGELQLLDALTFGPHTFPLGNARNLALVRVSELRHYLLRVRKMGVRFIAPNSSPEPAPATDEAPPIDWAAYRFREDFTLFEVACLLHRLDPRAVSDDAHHAIRRRGGTAAEVLKSPPATAEMLHLNPAGFFMPPVGGTLERLKRAAGSLLGLTVNAERVRALAAMLGVPYPPELEREAPAVVQSPADVPKADRGECVKRAALIERNRRRWLSIERDLKDASSNGLSTEARAADKPGFWWEGDALKWAEARNKVEEAQAAPVSLASLVHRMAG